jgi:hypothetical protein
MAFQDIRLRRRDPNPLLAQIIGGGGLQDVSGAAGQMQEGGLTADPVHLANLIQNRAQPTGSLADDRPESSVLLGTGMKAGGLGRAPVQYKRSVVRRHGKLLEAHSYGPGTETRYFERKNPAVLQAAAAQAAQQQTGAPVTAASGLSPRDEELLKMLLGNPTLHR